MICTNQKSSNRTLSALIVSVIRNVTFCVSIRWGMAQCGNSNWKCGESAETQGRNNTGSEGIRESYLKSGFILFSFPHFKIKEEKKK